MAGAVDVPLRYDLVVNGTGFLLDRRSEPNSAHQFTPTFLPRQNVTGSYGDNQQEFWLTLSQNDWSSGEQQRYIRVNDAESRRRYWRGSAIDVSVEGQVSLELSTISYAPAGTVVASCQHQGIVAFTVASNLYTVNHGGTISTVGAFTSTLTGQTAYGLCSDDVNVFIACPGGGTDGGIRKWNGSAFSDFAPSYAVSSVEFLNNTLFGVGQKSGEVMKLWEFSTSGVGTELANWQAADGAATANRVVTRLRRFGGKLMILFSQHTPGSIWEYDGTGASMLTELPGSFYATELQTVEGILFIGGSYYKRNTGNSEFYQRPAILYHVDGALNELWRADSYTASSYAIGATIPSANPVPFRDGILFWDSIRSQLTYYDIGSGATRGVSANTSVVGLGASASSFTWWNGPDSSHAGQFPDPTTVASTGYVRTSLFDADTAVPKYWKSVKVDADVPSGATFDIAYRVNDLDGSYTTVQSTATSGTEYALGVAGRSISIEVTLNKSGSTLGPTIKRIYVRGMPLLDTFQRNTYMVDCTGRDAHNPVLLRDGSAHTLTGLQMAQALQTAATATTPFTVTDEFGSYTALVEPETLRLERVRDREYRATFTLRQV